MAGKSPAKSSQHFLAGLGSGVASAVLLQPLDLLKTRVQQTGRTRALSTVREIASSRNRLLGLWRGTLPSTLRTGFGSALYFSVLNSLRTHVSRLSPSSAPRSSSSRLPTLSNTANLVTGATARTIAGLVLMPLTVIKVRYESSLYTYGSLWSAAKDIHSSAGVRGFFAGFGATAIRDAPSAGMYVLFYELLKNRLGSLSARYQIFGSTESGKLELRDGDGIGPGATTINFVSGTLAGAGCAAASNPFDAVKTRIQLEPDKYRNMIHACGKMARQDGLRSFLDGLGLRMARKAISSALAWTVYEELIRRAESMAPGAAGRAVDRRL